MSYVYSPLKDLTPSSWRSIGKPHPSVMKWQHADIYGSHMQAAKQYWHTFLTSLWPHPTHSKEHTKYSIQSWRKECRMPSRSPVINIDLETFIHLMCGHEGKEVWPFQLYHQDTSTAQFAEETSQQSLFLLWATIQVPRGKECTMKHLLGHWH